MLPIALACLRELEHNSVKRAISGQRVKGEKGKDLGQKEKERYLKKQLGSLCVGDLICVEWCDSVGKSSLSEASIDVPVKSWGVYVGLFSNHGKHIVIAQNSFRYTDDLYDLDYSAIPLSWTEDVSVLVKEHIQPEEAGKLVNSFLIGGNCRLSRTCTFQRHLSAEVKVERRILFPAKFCCFLNVVFNLLKQLERIQL